MTTGVANLRAVYFAEAQSRGDEAFLSIEKAKGVQNIEIDRGINLIHNPGNKTAS
jgi:hypothetical protein